MHFASISYLLLGLAASAVVQAAPRPPSMKVNALAPRGLPESVGKLRFTPAYKKRTPKGGNKDKDDEDVTIDVTDVTEVIQTGNTEIVFEEKVTQILIQDRSNTKKKNKKRKEEMKKKNKDVDIVIEVVQVIIDITSNSTRYATSQLLADNGSNSTITCMITDAATMTVGNGTCTAAASVASDGSSLVVSDATGTATGIMAMVTDSSDVSAPFIMTNGTMLLPSGAAAPVPAAGVEVMADPAADLAGNDTLSCGV